MASSIPTDVTGNEWMKVRQIDQTLFGERRPREQVLQEAREGIEKYRKGKVRLRLIDRTTNQPLPGQTLYIKQLEHAFDFGCSAGFTFSRVSEEPVQQARAAIFTKLFNCTTAKCYWDECWHQPIEKHQGIRITRTFLDEVDWALANGLRIRGHPLVWTVPKAVPVWMHRYSYDRQMMFLENHVRSMIQCTGGRVKLWDLVNEMLWEPSLRHLPDRNWPHLESADEMLTYIEPAVHWAREEDPSSTYVLNDYGLELNRVQQENQTVTATDQRRRFRELIELMYKRDCTPDAIGTQMHDGTWVPPDVMKKVLDELSSTGLPIQITEFWAHDDGCPDRSGISAHQFEEARIQYVTDCLTIAFGHPAVNHFTFWGNEMFYEDADPTVRHYRAAWQASRVYHAVHDLIKNQWQTPPVSLTTDSSGEVSFCGFLGKYEVRRTHPGGRTTCWSVETQSRRTEITLESD